MDVFDLSWMRRYPFPVVEAAVLESLGAMLRAARKESGFTRQETVALMTADIKHTTLSTYEWGKRSMSVIRLIDQCLALNAPLFTLLAMALTRARLTLEAEEAGEPAVTTAYDGADGSRVLRLRLVDAEVITAAQRAIDRAQETRAELAQVRRAHANDVERLRSRHAAELADLRAEHRRALADRDTERTV